MKTTHSVGVFRCAFEQLGHGRWNLHVFAPDPAGHAFLRKQPGYAGRNLFPNLDENAVRRLGDALKAYKPSLPGAIKAAAKPEMKVVGGGVIADFVRNFRVRPFFVVQLESDPPKVRAFYRSTGTGGQTTDGQWNTFGGMTPDWIVKAKEQKHVEKYRHVSHWLDRLFPTLDLATEAALQMGRLYSDIPEEQGRSVLTLRRYLASHDRLELAEEYVQSLLTAHKLKEMFKQLGYWDAVRDYAEARTSRIQGDPWDTNARELNAYLRSLGAIAPRLATPFQTVRMARGSF